MNQGLKTWLRVSRANFLPTVLLPYAVGSVFGARGRPFRGWVFVAGLAGSALTLLAANLFNEYWDHRLGADLTGKGFKPHYGGSRSIQERLVPPGAVRRAARLCLAAATAVGAGLSLSLGLPAVLLLGAGGAFLGWAYTAPPLSFVYRGWGEAAIFVAFGPLLVSGGYLLQSGRVDLPVLLLSPVSGFLIAGLLIVNELPDRPDDARAGKRNLAVRLGERKAVVVAGACLAGAYLAPVAGIAFRRLPPSFLLVLPTGWWAGRAWSAVRRSLRRGGEDYSAAAAGVLNLYFIFHIAAIVAGFF